MADRTIRAVMAHPDWERHAGRSPAVDGVRFEIGVWTGGGDPAGLPGQRYHGASPTPPDAEFYVPPWYARQASVDALAQMPSLQVTQLLNAGFDWIAGSVPPSVTLCNAGDTHSPAVAEWVLATLLAHVRDLPFYADAAARGRWEPRETRTLAGSEVVLLGYGSIGRALRAVLEPFGVTVHGIGRGSLASLGELLPRALALVVLTPLSAATRHQVDAAVLAQLADGAIVVNAARGPVVDNEALLAELQAGRLLAALDVTEPEPLPDGHPLFTAPGCIVTPHVAGSVPTFLPRAYAFVVDQLERYARGSDLQAVVVGPSSWPT